MRYKLASCGESVQTGDSSSSGTSETANVSEGIHRTPMVTPDEIARLFDRSTGRQIVLMDYVSDALARVNYDEDR